MTNGKEELMWTCMPIIFGRTAVNFELRDWGLCLTLPHVCVTLGQALSVLEPQVLSRRIFIRIKEANVYRKLFVICKMVYVY